ncbi:MAG: DUF481 domain-containing protein [Fidelibacterota bacterium]
MNAREGFFICKCPGDEIKPRSDVQSMKESGSEMRKILVLVMLTLPIMVHGGQWERSLNVSFSNQAGNTVLSSYAVSLSTDYAGDLKLGNVELQDTEVQLAVRHRRGELNRTLYQHDGSASFLLDVMAHGTFSPFFLSYWAYDSTTGLERRVQLGAGGKYSFPGGFSVSLAYLWEVEEYTGEPESTQYRWSLRPKYKKSLTSGLSVKVVIFIQPLARNFSHFLIDYQFTMAMPILWEKLKLAITWMDKYNSTAPEGVESRDSDVKIGVLFLF